MGTWLLALAAGALTTLSPCVLPLLPVLAAGAARRHRLAPLVMVAGLVSSFTAVGTALVASGSLLGLSPGVLRTIAAVSVITAGALVAVPRFAAAFAAAVSPLANGTAAATRTLERFGLAGDFGIGAALGLLWSPCSGPTLGGILGLAASDGLNFGTVIPLAIFGLGAAMPLLVFSYGAGFALRGRGLLQRVSTVAKPVLGAALLATGLLILTGLDKRLEGLLLDALPERFVALSQGI